MKQYTVATSLIISMSLFSQTPFAEPLKDKDAVLQPAFTWTGFYAGLNAGFVQHTMAITDVRASSFNATIEQTQSPTFSGGVQVGYRRQLDLSNYSGVFGLEFSDMISDAKFTKQYGSPYALYQLNAHNSLKNTALLEFIGGIAANKTLLFLAVGPSWINTTGNVKNTDGVPFFNAFSVSKNAQLSAVVGAGIEYAFSEKMSGRFKVDAILPAVYSTFDNTGDNYQVSNSVVQGSFGVNYRFG